jgi:hypothetical protein
MARILSVIKTETAYQINRNLVDSYQDRKITFLTSSTIRKIDYKTAMVVP